MVGTFIAGIWNSIMNDPMINLCFWATLGLCILLLAFSVSSVKERFPIISTLDTSQLAVTVGVAFTFVGIIYSLVNFNVESAETIRQSIATFLSGMKTAFITSIIGIFFGVWIKVIQSFDEKKSLDTAQTQSDTLLQNTEKILGSLNTLQESARTSNALQERTASGISAMAERNKATASITEAIESLKDSVEKYGSGALEKAINNLSVKMDEHIATSLDTRNAIREVADKLSAQTKAIDDLGMSLQKSSTEQNEAITTLGETLKKSGTTQATAITKLGNTLKESLKESADNQIAAINTLGETLKTSGAAQALAITTLSKTLDDSAKEQISRLDKMNGMIENMADYSEKAYDNSVKTLDEARAYQEKSLSDAQKQLEILSSNTDRITEMKDAFNKFLDDMAKKNNEEFIKALNRSMKELNEKLTEQFGDNFKQLNAAVIKLHDWQEAYKETIEKTTGELGELNGVFRKFSTDVAPALTEGAERLQQSLTTFAETSNKNIAIQDGLTEATQRLNDSIAHSAKASEKLQTIHDRLIRRQEEILRVLEDSFKSHKDKMAEVVKESADQFDEVIKQNQATVAAQMQATADIFTEVASDMETSLGAHKDKMAEVVKESANQFDAAIQQNKAVVAEQMQATVAKFADAVSTMENSLEMHKDKVAATVKEFADQLRQIAEQNKNVVNEALASLNKSMSDMKDANVTFTNDAITQIVKFNETTEEILNKISLALDGFNTDFQGELEKSMRDLKENLGSLLNENTRVAGEHGERLAALLGTITEKMVTEYSKLADHIAEIDRDIFERRAS